MYVILNHFKNSDGELQLRTVYGPYMNQQLAENANNDFPTPEYNKVVRLTTPHN